MLQAEFIPVEDRLLFCSMFFPDNSQMPSRCLLVFPAFAEEMNKCRRTVALLGKALAAKNMGLLLVDPHGTGDSSGDFSDARWSTWLADMQAATQWLNDRGLDKIDILAIRFGALLAWDWLQSNETHIDQLFLWQPVSNGKQMLTQFLRLRTAGALMGKGDGESVSDLRELLHKGETLEIAGYPLSAPLAQSIDASALTDLGSRRVRKIHWFDCNSAQGKPSFAAKKWLDQWSAQDTEVCLHAIKTEPFWITQEIVEANELVDLTVKEMLI